MLEAIAEADFVLFPPSNPVVSIGPILAVPGIRDAVAAKTVVAVSGIIGGAPVRGMADVCLTTIGVETTAAAVAAHYGAELLDGWLVDDQDKAAADDPALAGIAVRALPLYMRDVPVDRGDRPGRHRPRAGAGPMTPPQTRCRAFTPTFTSPAFPGSRKSRPATTWRALIADAATAPGGPGLLDGDILVVTSKVVSKAEGRVAAMSRDDAIAAETVRVVARRGATTISQTRHGFVMAAAGVDESNTAPGTVVLLPEDPDESARRLRKALRARLGVTVGVVVTDTMGRPWRAGQTDTAIGAAGVLPVRDHRGEQDTFGNTLEVTIAAVADEIAAAGDLVKSKPLQIPVALVRGLSALVTADDGPGARALVREASEDMFRLGAADVLPARRTVRSFTTAAGRSRRRFPRDRGRADRARAASQRALAVRDRVVRGRPDGPA